MGLFLAKFWTFGMGSSLGSARYSGRLGVRPLHLRLPSDHVCSGEDTADGLCGCQVCHHNRSLGTSVLGEGGGLMPILHSSTLCRGERELREGCQGQVYCAGEVQGRLGWACGRGGALKEPLCNLRPNLPCSWVALSPPSSLLSSLAGGLRSLRNLKPWTLRRQSTWRPTCQLGTHHQVTHARAVVRRGHSPGSG